MYTNIVTETDLGVGIITLNRPERHNAFDDALIVSLTAELQRLAEDAATRIVVLAARGRSFSAGADLGWMQRRPLRQMIQYPQC